MVRKLTILFILFAVLCLVSADADKTGDKKGGEDELEQQPLKTTGDAPIKKWMTKKELKKHAHRIPTEIVKPYPMSGSNGAETIVRKAATVVTLVKKIGVSKDFIVNVIA